MGAWGDGIFDDDLALDVKGHFDAAIARGESPRDAASRLMQCDLAEEILGEFPGGVHDDNFDWEETRGLFYAVAALQLEHDVLQPDVRDGALQAIAHHLDAIGEGDAAAGLIDFRARLERAHVSS